MSGSKGTLYIISGPSGCGKGTVVDLLLKRNKDLLLSVSATTRDMRAGETEGISYFFVSKEEFEKMIAEDELLEYNCGYNGNYYGTPKKYIFDNLDKGRDIILEIEMHGASIVKSKYPDAVSVFLAPPSLEELHNRLVSRGRESAELIEERFKKAKDEIKLAEQYNYVVVNDELNAAANKIENIILAQKCRYENNKSFINELIK